MFASDETLIPKRPFVILLVLHAGRIELQPDEWRRTKVLHATTDGDIALWGKVLRQLG